MFLSDYVEAQFLPHYKSKCLLCEHNSHYGTFCIALPNYCLPTINRTRKCYLSSVALSSSYSVLFHCLSQAFSYVFVLSLQMPTLMQTFHKLIYYIFVIFIFYIPPSFLDRAFNFQFSF